MCDGGFASYCVAMSEGKGASGDGKGDMPKTFEDLSADQQSRLRDLDEKVRELAEEGQDLEALDAMEAALIFRRKVFGLANDEVFAYRKRVAMEYNRLVVVFMDKGELKLSLELLEKAQILGDWDPTLTAMTYNNFGCYYRRTGKLRTALNYLREALKIEQTLAEAPVNLSDTHLNLSAIFSELGNRKDALKHARAATWALQAEIFGRPLAAGESVADAKTEGDVPKKRLEALVSSYYNLAVAEEYLGKYEPALNDYKSALDLADRIDAATALLTACREAFDLAEQHLTSKVKKIKAQRRRQLERTATLQELKKRVPVFKPKGKKAGAKTKGGSKGGSKAKKKKRPSQGGGMDPKLEERLRRWSITYDKDGKQRSRDAKT